MLNPFMRFLRKYQFLLLFLAVLVWSSLMVLRQIQARESAHVQRREDFLVLHERGLAQAEQRLYELLIQEFPKLSDRLLSDDVERTGLLVDAKKAETTNLVWKFHVAAANELRKRAEQRVLPSVHQAEQ